MSQHSSGILSFPFPCTARRQPPGTPPPGAERWVDLSGLGQPHASYLLRAPQALSHLGVAAGDLLVVEYPTASPGPRGATTRRQGSPRRPDLGGDLPQALREGAARVVRVFPGASGLGYVHNLRPLRRRQSCAQGSR